MGVLPFKRDDPYDQDESYGSDQDYREPSQSSGFGDWLSGVFEKIGLTFGRDETHDDLMDEILAVKAMRKLPQGVSNESDPQRVHDALQIYIDGSRLELSQDLTAPTWGPKITRRWYQRRKDRNFNRGSSSVGGRLRNIIPGAKSSGSGASRNTLEAERLMHQQDQEINFNLEQARRYFKFRWLYIAAAFASFAIVAAALMVDYSILKEFWHQAMMNEYMMVPAELQDSVSLKALQVLFATIGIHLVLRHMPNWVIAGFTGVIFVMTVLMMIAIGFLYAHKTLPVENQATVSGESTEESGLLGALADSGIMTGEDPAADDDEGGPIGQGLSEFFDAETLAWIDAVGWLVALTAIFLVVASIGALFLLWGEHNAQNYILAGDYKNRKRETKRLKYAEAIKLQIGDTGSGYR